MVEDGWKGFGRGRQLSGSSLRHAVDRRGYEYPSILVGGDEMDIKGLAAGVDCQSGFIISNSLLTFTFILKP
jgi:hypothetical protein